jgi:AcrR family transcriptional regulator
MSAVTTASRPAERQRPTNASGRETRQLLIRTAERLFAEQGVDAVSLRQISVAAGMRMTGAVAYHFGDKAGLIGAIVSERSVTIAEHCERLLDETELRGRLGDLRAVTNSSIRAGAAIIDGSSYFFRFLAQLDRHPQVLAELQASEAFRSAPGRIIALQDAAAAAHLPPKLVEHRRRLATHLVLAALADLEESCPDKPDAQLVDDLVDCVTALYTTPSVAMTT